MNIFAFSAVVTGIAIGFVISFAVMWTVCNRDKEEV
jgi:hypothetical protein